MADLTDLTNKAKQFDRVRDQLSKGWLTTEREKTRYSAAIDNLPIGFILVDDQYKVIKMNAAVISVLGENEKGEWTLELVQNALGFELDLIGTCKKALMERRSFGPFDIGINNKFVRFYISPVELLKESLAVFGVSIILEDITENRRLEMAKDKYFGVSAYEIQSPVLLLKNLIEKVVEEISALGDTNLNNQVAEIKTRSLDLLQVVNIYFNFSEFNRGSVPYRKNKVMLTQLIKQVIEFYKPHAVTKNIAMEFVEIEREVPEVIIDASRVRQVLSSLIDNAIKYSDKGTVTIFVEKKDTFLKVAVRDSGPGIPQEKWPSLFTKCVKENGEIALSLYISKLIIDDLGGEIYLEKSEIGAGSVFSFTLPIAYNV
ncbi:PAS domain-containing sensor histidine kinase [Candidatus Curtissbacteria bacterium]|nr:PAS domain-containing sensor histidine kinase [Candidatus Curtissbacteria bacterium]